MKQKRCRNCREHFTPFNSFDKFCSRACEFADSEYKRLQMIQKAKREERKADAVKLDKLKTIRGWTKEAQIAFNAFIRERDKDKPCICCGLPLLADAVGGGFDCGHYRSVGSAPHLRFDERNAHGQRKQCNRYGAGRAVDYRIGLIRRIGLQSVDALEADQAPRKYTIEDLKAIKAHYKQLLKEMQANG